MKQYYVQIQCFVKTDMLLEKPYRYIEEGFLQDHGEYLVYRDLKSNSPEFYKSMQDFKKDFVYDLRQFNKYVNMLELK